jgi:hypothetical protein
MNIVGSLTGEGRSAIPAVIVTRCLRAVLSSPRRLRAVLATGCR